MPITLRQATPTTVPLELVPTTNDEILSIGMIILVVGLSVIIIILLFYISKLCLRRLKTPPKLSNNAITRTRSDPEIPKLPDLPTFTEIYLDCPSTTTPRNSNTSNSDTLDITVQSPKPVDYSLLRQDSMVVSRASIDLDLIPVTPRYFDSEIMSKYLSSSPDRLSFEDTREVELGQAYSALVDRFDGIEILNKVFMRLSTERRFEGLWKYLITTSPGLISPVKYADEWRLLGDGVEVEVVKMFYCLGAEFVEGRVPGLRVGGRVIVEPK
jgi:hypothetical protein